MAEISRAELLYLVDRQREELKTLNSVGKLLSSTTDPQEVVRLLASHLRQNFPIAACAILAVPQKKLQIIRFAAVSEAAMASAVREGYAEAAEQLGQNFKREDIQEQLEDAPPGTDQFSHTPISSLSSKHVSALRFERTIIAILSVFSGKANAFSKDDQHAIDIVADQASAALRNAYLLEELRQADKLKHELLMLISHELHTPLTSISEGTNLILDGALGPTTPDQKEFLATINESAGRLGILIEKTLLATQLMTNQVGYKFGLADVAAMLKAIQQSVQAQADAKGVVLEFAGLSQPIPAHADEKLLRYAILQIVENAVHATPKGGLVMVRLATVGADVEIQVADTGPGIAGKDLESMFEQFSFTGTIDDRKTGGLGLGLFTAKGIIEGHRGSIKLESEKSRGTKIIIRLPSTPPP